MLKSSAKPSEIFQAAVSKWGWRSQFMMAVEEASELILVIQHYIRGRVEDNDVAEEVADMEIMCAQMREMVGSELVDAWKAKKLSRLIKRINGTADSKMGELNA